MTAEILTCPFCNAVVPPGPGLALGAKTACPRCGEAFTVTRLPAADAGPALPAGGPLREPPAPSQAPKPIRRNRLVGGAVVTAMLAMAGLGLVYALATVQTRRDHDRAIPRPNRKPWLPASDDPDAEQGTRPAELTGLGYLPPDTGLVAVLHPRELLGGPAGKAARAWVGKVGGREVSLASLGEWTGLAPEEFDYVVVGVDPERLPPPVHLVLHTRRSDGAKRIRVGLKVKRSPPGKTPEGGTRPLEVAQVGAITVHLWAADEQTVVLGVFSSLDRVSEKPAAGMAQLPRELRETVEKRVPTGVPFWAAGHAEDGKDTALRDLRAAALDSLPGWPLAGRLDEVRSFAAWLTPTSPPRAGGAFQFATDAAAAKVAREVLRPRQEANPEAFRFSRSGAWVEVQQTLSGPAAK